MILEIISVVIIVCACYSGWQKGFVRAVCHLLAFVIVCYLAGQFASPVSSWLNDGLHGQFIRSGVPEVYASQGPRFLTTGVAYMLLVTLGMSVAHIFLRQLRALRRLPVIGGLDCLLGGACYGIISAVFVFFGLQLLSVLPHPWLVAQFSEAPLLTTVLNDAPFLADQVYHWWL